MQPRKQSFYGTIPFVGLNACSWSTSFLTLTGFSFLFPVRVFPCGTIVAVTPSSPLDNAYQEGLLFTQLTRCALKGYTCFKEVVMITHDKQAHAYEVLISKAKELKKNHPMRKVFERKALELQALMILGEVSEIKGRPCIEVHP